jgi:phosphoglycolate phosphatase-like HAD superfamily hydrolase
MSSGNDAVKAIFWDNDGVLVDTEQLYFLPDANRVLLDIWIAEGAPVIFRVPAIIYLVVSLFILARAVRSP